MFPSNEEQATDNVTRAELCSSLENCIDSTRDINTWDDNALDQLLSGLSERNMDAMKTWSRWVVDKFLINQSWYNPQVNSKNGPNLQTAWTYYEHMTIARRFINIESHNTTQSFKRAERGEHDQPTELFPVFTTPQSALKEWGIGVGIYFHSLRFFSIILLIAGCISIPNIVYFASEMYDPVRHSSVFVHENRMLSWTLIGSAVCNTTRVVNVLGETKIESESTLVQMLANDCNGVRIQEGMVNYGAFLFLIGATLLWGVYQYYLGIFEDEGMQTSSDYSVQVKNPPPDATDPEEWRTFFNTFCEKDKEVVFCTIALNNNELINALVSRRTLREKLRHRLPDIDIDNEQELHQGIQRYKDNQQYITKSRWWWLINMMIKPVLQQLWYNLPVDTLALKIEEYTGKVVKLQQKKYEVTDVFVTFESEEGQRTALHALQAGKLDVCHQRTHNFIPSSLFRGDIVLDARQPEEPSSIRWISLHVSAWKKITQRLITFTITSGLIAVTGYVINKARMYPLVAGFLTSSANFIIPIYVKMLMMIESHSSEGSYQSSLYLKITFFRWVNTAIMTRIVTNFKNTLGTEPSSLLTAINGILISELIFVPLLRMLDLYGNVMKHFFAPRAKTQRAMNLFFKGTFYNLGERYTDFTKVLLVCYFYSALNPISFFIGSATLTIQYYVDKFCLLRIWMPAPLIGTSLVKTSWNFFSLAVVISFVMCSYDWVAFPFDNICLYQNSNEVRECPNQDPLHFNEFPFPAVPNKQTNSVFTWMSSEQERLTQVFGWTSVIVVVGFLVIWFGYGSMIFLMSWFRGTYKPHGKNQNIDFTNVREKCAYIPQMRASNFAFPVVACDIDDIDKELLGWKDGDNSYDFHNMVFDIPYDGLRKKERSDRNNNNGIPTRKSLESDRVNSVDPIFSIVKQWSPQSVY